jgi:hypothetical protein
MLFALRSIVLEEPICNCIIPGDGVGWSGVLLLKGFSSPAVAAPTVTTILGLKVLAVLVANVTGWLDV